MIISEKEILEAQRAWGDGLIAIGQAGTKAKAEAKAFLERLYDFVAGPVGFNPTKACLPANLRPDLEGALSYFVGGNEKFPKDHGFALNPWVKVEFDNVVINIWGDIAQACGNYTFTAPDGTEAVVEYTFTYRKDDGGNLRIVGHHSSIPYPA